MASWAMAASPIHGYIPQKKLKQGSLTYAQKFHNRKLSEVQVVVENSIHVIKTYKILGGVSATGEMVGGKSMGIMSYHLYCPGELKNQAKTTLC